MQKSLISDARVEKILFKLRKEILIMRNNNRVQDLSNYTDFIISLAEQCFLNEYVYLQTKNEINQIKILQNELEKNKQIKELDVAILGCYMPLFFLKNLKKKLISYKSDNVLFNNLIKIQITEINKEQELKKNIKSHGKIINTTSQKVKKQYEKKKTRATIAICYLTFAIFQGITLLFIILD